MGIKIIKQFISQNLTKQNNTQQNNAYFISCGNVRIHKTINIKY